MNKHIKKLGQEKVPKLIIKMAIPAIISMTVQALYNIVDSVFVASISEDALTALSLAFPVQIVIIAIFVGLGVGLNSVISRRLGEKNMKEAVNAAEHGFLLGFLLWGLIAVASIFLPQWYFSMFTEKQIIIDYAIEYTTVVMLFSFGCIFSQVCMSIMQATGDMVSSMKIQLVGAVTNIILDPILIFGVLFIPGFGVKGAAIATVAGQIISMLYAFRLMFKSDKGLKLNLRNFHFDLKVTSRIMGVGLPAMIMQALGSVMLTGVNYILYTLGDYGDTSIAVFGAYFKVQSLIFMPVIGLGQGMMPIVGYNYGAKNKHRIIEAVRFSAIVAFSIMAVGTIIFQLFPGTLLKMFSSTPNMESIGIPAFRILSSVFPIVGVLIMFSISFQAIGDAYKSMTLSFVRQIVVLLPVAFLLSGPLKELGVWISFPIAEGACLILTTVFVIMTYNKKIKNLEMLPSEPQEESIPQEIKEQA